MMPTRLAPSFSRLATSWATASRATRSSSSSSSGVHSSTPSSTRKASGRRIRSPAESPRSMSPFSTS